MPERLIVHQAYKDFFVAIHTLDEQVLKLLVEYRFEIFDAVGHDGLSQLFIGYGGFTNLIEEELVGRSELGAEPLIEFANQGRKLHIFVGLAGANLGWAV